MDKYSEVYTRQQLCVVTVSTNQRCCLKPKVELADFHDFGSTAVVELVDAQIVVVGRKIDHSLAGMLPQPGKATVVPKE